MAPCNDQMPFRRIFLLLHCAGIVGAGLLYSLGINLFVASGMTKIPLLNLAKATVPFLIAFLVCLALIVFVPGLSLWLPSILG